MKMYKSVCRVLSILLVLALLAVPFCTLAVSAESEKKPIRVSTADTAYYHWIDIDQEDVVATADFNTFVKVAGDPQINEKGYYLAPKDSVTASLAVPADGKYAVVLDYQVVKGQLSDSTVEVTAGDTMVLSGIYGLWQDETKNYNHDRYGNEVTPDQVLLDEFVSDYVRDSKSLNMMPYEFDLAAGVNTVNITNCDEDVVIKSVSIVKVSETPTYEEYLESAPKMSSATEMITIEGEDYAVKSDSYIRSQSKQNAAVYPYSPYEKYLSTIDCGSYDKSGQRVMWNFEVPESGWYNLALHYSQYQKEGMSTYRDIEIDGEVLFEELLGVSFSYTGNGFENRIITEDGSRDGKPVKIYLEKGKHTIGLYTQATTMQPFIDEINEIIDEISDIGLSLQQIAGSSADSTRTWEIETYMPGVIEQLEALQDRMLDLYDEMGKESGTTPSSCMNLKTAASIIKQVLKKPKKLPAKVSQLSIGTGSVTELLASLENDIRLQGIALDRLYFYGEDNEIPAEDANFFVATVAGIKRFFYSLFNTDGAYAATASEEGVLSVWMNRSITYVETLQLLTDSYFTPETGIEVQLSVMPDANKLILANASDTCPDVALGMPYSTPYSLGLRGAAADLTQFDDFIDVAENYFYKADLEPYIYDGKFYGLPETMQFYVLMCRRDIMDKFNIDTPQTWEDIANVMPVLRRSGMTFYMPLSAYTGTKGLDGILPFFFQENAQIYSDDAMTVTFNSNAGIRAFETLTDLYRLYGVQNNMPSFYNNFRYGVSPIGIGNFSNYMQIYYAAPEIADAWDITLVPGTRDSEGNINRQQFSADRGVLIMESSELKQEAWEYIKWWLSDETQTEFGHTMLVKFGSGFVWNTANKDAFTKMSLPSDDRAVIIEQWENAENYRNMPVTYMLERELSDAWYSVINDGTPARIALNEAVATVNTELETKMREFGYVDDNGEKIKEYNNDDIDTVLANIKKGGEE